MKKFLLLASIFICMMLSGCSDDNKLQVSDVKLDVISSEMKCLDHDSYECDYTSGTYTFTLSTTVLYEDGTSQKAENVSYSVYTGGWMTMSAEVSHTNHNQIIVRVDENLSYSRQNGTIEIDVVVDGCTYVLSLNIYQNGKPEPKYTYNLYRVSYKLNSTWQRVHELTFSSHFDVRSNISLSGTIAYISLDGSNKGYMYDAEKNEYYDFYDCEYGETAYFNQIYKADVPLEGVEGVFRMNIVTSGIGWRNILTTNYCTDMLTSLLDNTHTFLRIDLYKGEFGTVSTENSIVSTHEWLPVETIEVPRPVKGERPFKTPTYCSHNSGGGTGGGGGSSNEEWGTVKATLSSIGPGVYYSDVATNADGRSVTVDYVYNSAKGTYTVYGGAWCSDPSANGGKGVAYRAQKGYNNIVIYAGAYYDSYYNVKYNWEIHMKFTLP